MGALATRYDDHASRIERAEKGTHKGRPYGGYPFFRIPKSNPDNYRDRNPKSKSYLCRDEQNRRSLPSR